MKGREHSPGKIYLLSDENKQEFSKEDVTKQENHISSPTKTIKSLFRMSIYSSSSINSDASPPKRSPVRHLNTEVISPSKSKIGEFFKPKFNMSRSSFTTNTSSLYNTKLKNTSSISVQEHRPTTLEDFADTSTESSRNISGYDAESINSILKEYEDEKENQDFLFKEEFDETKSVQDTSKITSDESTTNQTKTSQDKANSEIPSRRKTMNKSVIELTLDDAKLSSSSSSSPHSFYDAFSESPRSSRFVIYEEKKDTKKAPSIRRTSFNTDRRKVLSTSSNIDILNRSSFYNTTVTSDATQRTVEGKLEEGKYPDPSISLMNTPKWTNNTSSEADGEGSSVRMSYSGQSISERPLHTVIIDESFDANETILKDPDLKDTSIVSEVGKSVVISSMSSGELLSKLETFQPIPVPPDTSEIISNFTHNISEEKINVARRLSIKKIYENLQSSDDSSMVNTEAQKRLGVKQIVVGPPILVSNPRPAYLPSSDIMESISSTKSPTSAGHPSLPVSSNRQFVEKKLNQNISDFRHNRPWSLASPNLSVSKPQSNIRLSDNLTKKNSYDYLLEDAPKPSYLEPVSSGSIYSSEDLEKNPHTRLHRSQPTSGASYSWLLLVAFMLIGLIIPPLFFLLTLGFCDNFNTYPHYYNGIIHWSQPSKNLSVKHTTHFSKTQKIVSFAVGVVWLAIIVATIIVGLCVGISSVS